MSRLAHPSAEEGDFICAMVLKVVSEVVRQQRLTVPEDLEPTGFTYDPSMRPYVELRADQRGLGQGWPARLRAVQ